MGSGSPTFRPERLPLILTTRRANQPVLVPHHVSTPGGCAAPGSGPDTWHNHDVQIHLVWCFAVLADPGRAALLTTRCAIRGLPRIYLQGSEGLWSDWANRGR